MGTLSEVSDSENKQRAIVELTDRTKHDKDFYVLLVGATFLAAGAIFTDSIPTLIASMIVAPLAYPILALGLGIASGSWRLALRALLMLGVACLVVLGLAMVLTMLVGSDRTVDKYVSFAGNRHIAVGVAVASGAIAAYGLVRPKVASAITGVAIAVSLLPPLVATGVGLVPGGASTGLAALNLFLLNVLGILLASIFVFGLFGMKRHVAASTQ